MHVKLFCLALIYGGVLSLSTTAAQGMLVVDDAKSVHDHDHDHDHDGTSNVEHIFDFTDEDHDHDVVTDENTFNFEEVGKWDVDRDTATAVVAGTGATLTYSFVTSDSVGQVNTNGTVTPVADALPNGSVNVIRQAFEAWSDVANITFIEVPDSGLDHFEDLLAGRPESGADVRIGAFPIDGRGSTRARANVRSVNFADLREFRGALITFDLAENWVLNGLDGDNRTLDVFNIAAHEIGHVIGLNHTNVDNSLMNTGSARTESFRGPQADDIAGAQFLYGPPPPPITGDFDADGNVDGDDVDFYIGNLNQPATVELARLDLNGDGIVTIADHNFHVTTLVVTSNGVTGASLGDVNLDGLVDVVNDAFALVGSLGQSVTSRSRGDLNADSVVDVINDAFILVGQLGQTNDL